MRTSYIAGGGASGSTPVVNQSALWANRASYQSNGNVVRFTDVGGGAAGTGLGTYWAYNSTLGRWKPQNGPVMLDGIDTANVGTAQIAIQNLNPNHAPINGGVIGGNGDRLVIAGYLGKSGTTDTYTVQFTLGSGGGTADTVIASLTMAAASRGGEFELKFKRISATSIQIQSVSGVWGSIAVESAVVQPAAVVISSLDSILQYIGVCVTSTGTTDAPTLADMTAFLVSSDSN